MTINLADHTSPELSCLVGKDQGANLRKLITDPADSFLIIIPDNIVTISRSFFFEMFGSEVKKLGRTTFLNKYHFRASDHILNKIYHNYSQDYRLG